MSRPHRSPLPRRAGERGFVLIALLVMLTMGGLYFLVSNLTPEAIEARRQEKTTSALAQAKDALLGYAVRYRELQLATGTRGVMYGYLPLPDLGSSRNNNATDTSCYPMEGCEAYNFSGNAINATVIGRFPWRSLGTGPLQDGHGECLWYAVSGSHQRNQPASPMTWDTLSHLDIVVANGTASMISAIISAHDRPIAVIFSPGPPLPGQDRSPSASGNDNVTECGGNYNVANYLDPSPPSPVLLPDTTNSLDPATLSTIGGIFNFFGNSEKQASGVTQAANKLLSAGGIVKQLTDSTNSNTFWIGNCPSGAATTCTSVANDSGLGITSEQLFRGLRGSVHFRTDINTMLDRMTGCLRDQVAAIIAFTPDTLTNFTPPSDKAVGRIPATAPTSDCYNDAQNPLGYFSHYKEQFFLAMCPTPATNNCFTVTVDGVAQACPAAVIFSSQRGTKNPVPADTAESAVQLRTTAVVSANNPNPLVINTNWPANYLEGANLTSFTTDGALSFTGPSLFAQVSASQTANQDIVRCIPAGANLTVVESPNLSAAQQLVTYAPDTSTLTLGKADVTNSTASSTALFGCAWIPNEKTLGSGLRSYFQFSFATVGTNVGNTGFVFSLIDAESNISLPCGSAGSHLGYSGDNGVTPKVQFPKIGIEFDQSRNSNFSTTLAGQQSTNAGRKDPCYTCASGTADTHAAIVYWGHEGTNATDSVLVPDYDDNVHGFPTAASLATTRRPPKNPDTSPGIEFINLRTGGQLFHVRVEVTPTRSANAAMPENSQTSMQTKVWILGDSVTVANQIIAMKDTTRPMSLLYAGFTETLSDTGAVFDVAGAACSAGSCPANQTCGSDNICYRQGLRKARLGFTGSQRTQDQQVTITNMFTTWLP